MWKNNRIKELIIPKFKIGDKIRRINDDKEYVIDKVGTTVYHYLIKKCDNRRFVGSIKMMYQDEYELVSDKFDISTLIPFESKVLVRDFKDQFWRPAIFGGYIDERNQYKFLVIGGLSYECLIPYEGNEHLRCKTDDCDDYYKTWE